MLGVRKACRDLASILREIQQENDRIKAENAKLRKEVEQWHRLTAGIELPEYPITEFKPKDLERENTKLRELVLQLWECPVDDNKCTDCPHCKEHYDVCAGENHCKLYDQMRELGVEVS